MKIIRKKVGYQIDLTDSEYEALLLLVTYGEADVEVMEDFEYASFSRKEKIGLSRITAPGSWAITEDQRKDK